MKTKTASLATLVWLATVAMATAQHEHAGHAMGPGSGTKQPAAVMEQPQAGPHGGTLRQVDGMQIETVVAPGGLRVFAYDRQGQPMDVRDGRGLAMLKVEGGAKRYRYDLYPEIAKDGSAASLAVAVDLSRIAGRNVDVEYQLVGLPGSGRRPAKFVESVRAPITEAQMVALAIEEQAVCPVSGQPLGGMGKPVPVTIGSETLYVCCAGCIDAVKAEPAKYLAMVKGQGGTVPFGNEEVRPGVYKITAADKPFIAAQKNCPVMDEPLGGMGEPLKVHAAGKAIYICCAGCAKKIAAEPAKYLQVLAQQGVTAPTLQSSEPAAVPATGEQVRPGVFKVSSADQAFVAAQKLCPVMDEPLDGMGGPYRVVVEGQAVYICCPGCAKKLQSNPKAYLQKLADQGVTPPVVR